jgi:hypothetical protein
MTTQTFSNKKIIIGGLIGGFFINLCDVTVTVSTVADAWNQVLINQGIAINPLTPAYYVSASFVAGIILCWAIATLSFKYELSGQTALRSSFLLWGISRLYGMGHVVMGQMPIHIFAIMSAGLLLGFVVGGQMIYRYLKQVQIPVNHLNI